MVAKPELPENIQWENMGVNPLEQKLRRAFVMLIAIVVGLTAFSGILFMKGMAE